MVKRLPALLIASATFAVALIAAQPAVASEFVTPDNHAPEASGRGFHLVRDHPITFALTRTDADNDALTFTPQNPAHGTLSGTASSLTYTPHRGFVGTDSFLFTATDGVDESVPALIQFSVVSDNHPPTATARVVTTTRNRTVVIQLSGTDPENSRLGSGWQPARLGKLSGYGSPVTYTPPRDFTGVDSFTFAVSDGDVVSRSATITVIVTGDFPSMGEWKR